MESMDLALLLASLVMMLFFVLLAIVLAYGRNIPNAFLSIACATAMLNAFFLSAPSMIAKGLIADFPQATSLDDIIKMTGLDNLHVFAVWTFWMTMIMLGTYAVLFTYTRWVDGPRSRRSIRQGPGNDYDYSPERSYQSTGVEN